MRIRDYTFDPPLALAPMSGITDRSFRLLCREQGAALVWTGLISANALAHGNEKTIDLLTFMENEHPICAQIFGADPELISCAALAAERNGADMVDINMGCAVPKIVKTGSGVALMAMPERAESLIRASVAVVTVPVLVKIRRGWSDRGEDAVAFSLRCQRAGAAAVAVHPRWARQGFTGKADWSVIRAVKESVQIPVFGSGDIHCAEDALRMREETGCDGIMIGRAALGNPWIFRETARILSGEPPPIAPTLDERLTLAARHIELVVRDRGERLGIREMRKHLAWYLKGMPNARVLRDRANRGVSCKDLHAVLEAARESAKEIMGGGEN